MRLRPVTGPPASTSHLLAPFALKGVAKEKTTVSPILSDTIRQIKGKKYSTRSREKATTLIGKTLRYATIMGTMEIFDGRANAQKLEAQIRDFLNTHPERTGSNAPRLAIVQIGECAESSVYVRLKVNLLDKLGIPVEVFEIDSEEEDSAIIKRVQKIFTQNQVSGGIIQLPLPRKSLESVLGVIPLEKDTDGLSPEFKRRFYAGEFYRLPPAVRAFDYFTHENNLDLERLSVGVIGYGELVGKPIAHYATLMGANTECIGWYERGNKLPYQLVVSSAGVPNLVDPHDLEPGAAFVDFGSSRKDNKTVGDLDMDKDLTHLSVISPSPGGMGSLVVRFLVMNFLGI